MEIENIFEVYKIVDKRVSLEKVEYLVQWKYYSSKWNTWEPVEHLSGCEEMVARFEKCRASIILGARQRHGNVVYLLKLLSKPSIEEISSEQARKFIPKLVIAFLEDQLKFVVGNPENVLHDINEIDTPDHEPCRIIYATDIGTTLKYLVEYGDGIQHKFVNASFAHRHYPILVIQYLEQRINFN